MNKIINIFLFLVLCVPVCLAVPKDVRDEKTKPYEVKRVIKTVDGHNFLVPEDRPVEMIAGQYRPIDIDTYVAYKFGTLKEEMDVKFVIVEEKILKLEQEVKNLNAKVEDLTSSLKKLQEGADVGGAQERVPAAKGA